MHVITPRHKKNKNISHKIKQCKNLQSEKVKTCKNNNNKKKANTLAWIADNKVNGKQIVSESHYVVNINNVRVLHLTAFFSVIIIS